MKILVIHPIDDYYGATRILSHTIPVLDELGVVDVWTKNDIGALSSLLGRDVVEVRSIPLLVKTMFTPRGVLNFLCDCLMFLGKVKVLAGYDLIYINTITAAPLCFYFWILRKKVVVHCHEVQDEMRAGRLLARFVAGMTGCVICVSRRVSDYISSGRSLSNVHVVHNGIPQELSKRRLSRSNSKTFNVILIGRLTPGKGYWYLADALSLISESTREYIKIDCYGDAPSNHPEYVQEFEEYIGNLGVSKNFSLKGFDADANTYIKSYDMLIVPSVMADPFPTTVLEGLGSGVVVLTTDNGGAAEIIRDGETGFLVGSNDRQGLAAKLTQVLRSESLAEVAEAGHSLYLERFTLDKYRERLTLTLQAFAEGT